MADPPRRRRIPRPGFLAGHRNGVEVTKSRLWAIFAEARILAREASGELTVRVVYNEPASPLMNQPPGARSIRLAYYDAEGKKVAETHHFELPDGTIGASGKRDPKEVVHNGVLYFVPPGG